MGYDKGHPNAAELLDLADGRDREKWALHLEGCDVCRRQVADLADTMRAARAVNVPEPSPLFWEHLSARVRASVPDEPTPSWIERWFPVDRWVWMNRRTSFGLAIAAV